MTAILGISAFYHDAAAALLVDGRIVAAAQEERFTRVKHDPSFPAQAIAYCLKAAGLTSHDLDYVACYEKPLLKFDRLLETYLAFAPMGFRAFRAAIPRQIHHRLDEHHAFRAHLPGYRRRIVYGDHHMSHAASAFYPSPFDEAAIMTLDGVGEWATASYGLGQGHTITLMGEQRFPHSLGLLYSAFTSFCGFRVNDGEYKLMGLAPYGLPRYADQITRTIVDIRDDGSLWLDQSYFNYAQGLTMTSSKFVDLFGGPPRPPDSPITERERDLAASIQAVTEEVMLRSARHVHAKTGAANLCLAGGVALNCVGVGRIAREGPFDRVWVQPAAGDAGGALGAAQHVWYQRLESARVAIPTDAMQGAFLGPSYSDEEIEHWLEAEHATRVTYPDDEGLCDAVARLIADQLVLGWLQGRMEFGPRALGARSILADARSPTVMDRLNRDVKLRESFRPFAPAILQSHVSAYFEMDASVDSPYMSAVAHVRPEVRAQVPGVTHVDGSARVQTVDAGRHGRFHRLLSAFHRQTGCPLIINTSFNVRGESVVMSPEHAYRCFMSTNLDALVMGRSVLLRREQRHRASD
jgi:carbamoyltransferase